MQAVKLNSEERALLRRIGKKAYQEMVASVGKKRMADLSREHGKKGGRPRLYEACTFYKFKNQKGKTVSRHRFIDGKCKCGEIEK